MLTPRLMVNLKELEQKGFAFLKWLIEPNLEFLNEQVAIRSVDLS
jgi:hypothetical protein